MSTEAEKEALKQLGRLEKMHPDASEASIIRTYIEWLTEMPWNHQSRDNLNLKRAKAILDQDHYGLKKIKERILEYLAVRKLTENMKGPILCFFGPPGVGKTSLGYSIAKALEKAFVRISLGGMKDESEIRGHRRTYVGALPGKIAQALKQAKTNNPVILLDEIDKIGNEFRSDPAAALLEVLDPEQNHSFRDYYINLPMNLSNVMFIAACNTLDTISYALKDRMEVIHIPGYTEEEKFFIAKRYLIPKQIRENGIHASQIEFTDEATRIIYNDYAREAGLRSIEKNIATICRKKAKRIAEGETQKTKVDVSEVYHCLGSAPYHKEDELEKNEVGIATGLAWTLGGGEIIYVEVSTMKGRGDIIFTGQIGNIMKESGQTALGLVRSRAKDFQQYFSEDLFSNIDIHVHFPAGSVPKDGSSAGITITTAMISRLTGIAVRKNIGMTGEMTLTGRILPIGGLKEKLLAARRHKIRYLIIPEKNKKELEEIPEEYRERLKFFFVKTIDDVLEIALVKKIHKIPIKTLAVRKKLPFSSRLEKIA